MSQPDWIKNIPRSKMAEPETSRDHFMHFYWRLYTPLHPYVRDFATAVGIVRHQGRQPFLLGKVIPEMSLEEFARTAVARGFANHFVAWRDAGEVVSLRYAPNFTYQYHLRIFDDREVRGHYEYTPESRPFDHMHEKGMEERREEFLRMFGDCIVTAD